MDRTFQDKIEHETKQLKKRGLARQFHFTNLKLSEKNEKKKDFRHWSDAGREWREVIVEASVSDKYLSKDNENQFNFITRVKITRRFERTRQKP